MDTKITFYLLLVCFGSALCSLNEKKSGKKQDTRDSDATMAMSSGSAATIDSTTSRRRSGTPPRERSGTSSSRPQMSVEVTSKKGSDRSSPARGSTKSISRSGSPRGNSETSGTPRLQRSTSSSARWQELEELLKRRTPKLETFKNSNQIPIRRVVREPQSKEEKNARQVVEYRKKKFIDNCVLDDQDMIINAHKIKFELLPFESLGAKNTDLLAYMSNEYLSPILKKAMSTEHIFLLAKAEGHIVGFAKIEFASDDVDDTALHVNSVFVEPEFVKYKVSTKLVKIITNTAQKLKKEKIFTVVVDVRNVDEIEAFESNEYKINGKGNEYISAFEKNLS